MTLFVPWSVRLLRAEKPEGRRIGMPERGGGIASRTLGRHPRGGWSDDAVSDESGTLAGSVGCAVLNH